mgnify:CR=1 FL=1
MSEVTLTAENFDSQIQSAAVPMLVDFWASWCGPCRMLAPVLEDLAEDLGDAVLVGKVNVDDQPALAARFGVQSIPTVIAFKNGKECGRTIGVVPQAELEKLVQ